MASYTFSGLTGEGRVALPAQQLITIIDWTVTALPTYGTATGTLSPRRLWKAGYVALLWYDSFLGAYSANHHWYLDTEAASYGLLGDANALTTHLLHDLEPGTVVDVSVEY